MTTTTDSRRGAGTLDARSSAALPDADVPVCLAWEAAIGVAAADPPPMDLSAGERPVADVEVLAGACAALEYGLAMRMHGAAVAGAVPLRGGGALLTARGWSSAQARRLARAGALAASQPVLAEAWAAGIITSEHVDAVARHCDPFTPPELAAVVGELGPLLGQLSPTAIGRFVHAAARMLHPPQDPTADEADAHASRDLSFAVLSDTIVLSGQLPRVEGELVMAAIDAVAETLRSTADHVPAGARRADALVQLVNDAHASGELPTRGGLPVSLTVSLSGSESRDPVWTTSGGHVLTEAERRWASCDAQITPVRFAAPGCTDAAEDGAGAWGPARRIAALARTFFDTVVPLEVGRTARTATAAQRRALAVRDRGCIIPGCRVPAEACQTHHLAEWAEGGPTDLPNLVLICWAHHRQVDLHMWTIRPGRPPAVDHGTQGHAGRDWPGNNGSPWTINRTPRQRWRL